MSIQMDRINPKGVNDVLYAGQFPGADIGAKVNAAIAMLPAAPTGGTIQLPSGVSAFSTPIVIDRPVRLVGCGSGPLSSAGGGTALQWTGGASVAITISGSNAAGSTLEYFGLDNTGTGTVGVDVDAQAYYVTLRNVAINPQVRFGVGLRVGNTAITPLLHVEKCVIANNTVNVALGATTATVFIGGGIYGGSTNDVQIGNLSGGTSFCVGFFGTEIESTCNSCTVNNIQILSAQSVLFSGCYAEQFASPSSVWLSIPNTAFRADNIVVSGLRLNGNAGYVGPPSNSGPNTVFSVNFNLATLAVVDSAFYQLASGATLITNTNARHVWTNNITLDANYPINTSNTNYDSGTNYQIAGYVAPYHGATDNFAHGLTATGNVTPNADQGANLGSATLRWIAFLYSAGFYRSQGNNTAPDIVGDGTHALVIGGKGDGSGSVAFGATTAVSVTGGLTTNTETLTAAAPTVSASQVGLGSTTATTATAGANGAVPAQVAGYLIINVAGTNVKVPYFNT